MVGSTRPLRKRLPGSAGREERRAAQTWHGAGVLDKGLYLHAKDSSYCLGHSADAVTIALRSLRRIRLLNGCAESSKAPMNICMQNQILAFWFRIVCASAGAAC